MVVGEGKGIEMMHEAVLTGYDDNDDDRGRPKYGYRIHKTVRWEDE